MPMTIRPPSNASSAVAQPRGGLGACRSAGPRCRSARSPRARSASRSPARAGRSRARRPSVRVHDLAAPRRLAATSPTTSVDPLVEQERSGRWRFAGPLAAHRDVHEAGLVDVLAGRVDDHDLDLAAVDPAAQLLDQQVGGQGAPDAAAEDEDALHVGLLAPLLDDDLVVAVAGLEGDEPVARPSRPTSGCRSSSPCPRSRRR